MDKILIIDPEKSVTFTLRKLLEHDFSNVLSCNDLITAEDITNANRCDLIIVNSGMKSNDGTAIIPYLQKKYPASLFIAITENSRENKNPPEGVIGAINKPIDFFTAHSEILKMIRRNQSDKGLTGISLEDYLQIFCLNKMTKAILVKKETLQGIIMVHNGKVVYAVQDRLIGEKAFYKILSWNSKSLKEIEIKKIPPHNIEKNIEHLLLDAAYQIDEGEADDTENELLPEEVMADFSNTFEQDLPAGNKLPAQSDWISAASQQEKTARGQTKGLVKMALFFIPLLILLGLGGYYGYQKYMGHPNTNGDAMILGTAQANQGTEKKAMADTAPAETADPKAGPKGVHGKKQAAGQLVSTTANETELLARVIQRVIQENKITPAETTPAETILRLHGSNTIGEKLAPALVKKYLTQKLEAKQITVKAGDHANESTILAIVDNRHIGIEIHAHGSSTGFKDLAAGKCDIAMASRQIKDKEIDKLAFLGDMSSISSEHVIGLDGIAVIVNKVNTINKLAISQIKEAFNGSITDWGQLGGNSGSLINVYSRDDNSGTYDTFKSIVLGEETPLINTAKRYESNPVLSDDVSKDRNGIGFTGLPHIRRAKALSVSDGAGQVILPTFFTVATEDYPISRRLYMYCSPIPDNPNVQPFIDFVHSEAGQKTVQEIGFVDMNIRSFHMPPPSAETATNQTVLNRYLNAIKDAKRLSLNFRFKKAASELDNRSIRDLDRMVKFLTDKEEQIILVGFADNSGDYNFNLELAMGRAQKVASEMQSRGIIPSQVLSCSEELPVASNDSAKGREKNRRVEVWIK